MTWWGWALLVWFALSVPAAVLIGRAIALRERRDEGPGTRLLGDEVDDRPPLPGPRDGQESA